MDEVFLRNQVRKMVDLLDRKVEEKWKRLWNEQQQQKIISIVILCRREKTSYLPENLFDIVGYLCGRFLLWEAMLQDCLLTPVLAIASCWGWRHLGQMWVHPKQDVQLPETSSCLYWELCIFGVSQVGRSTGNLGARGCVTTTITAPPEEDGEKAHRMGAPLLAAACHCTRVGEKGF